MIIKGTSRSGPSSLAAHLGNAEKNERVQLLETRGTVANDLRGALIEMDTYAMGTRCQKPLYHAAISPEPPHRFTPEQRTEAIDALEQKLGLDGHPRVVVLHEKQGREHLHVVWTRIDVHHMRTVHDGHNYRKHEEVARDLEDRFGQPRVQGAHHERLGPNGEKVKRPDRTPSRSELRQEERTGLKGKQVKEEVSAAFKVSDNAEAFRAALSDRGYQLAVGDRRDFVIIDPRGGVHSLARRIDGMKAAPLREFMATVDPASVLPVIEAQFIAQERVKRLEAIRDANKEDRLEAQYARGDDYVNQSQSAQRDFEKRSDELTERERLRRENADRQAASKEVTKPVPQSEPHPEGELTDGMQERLDRLRAAKADAPEPTGDPGRQNQTPEGGRSRSH